MARKLALDSAEYIHRRKAKYMAQTLEAFEEAIEPLLSAHPSAVQDFKGLVRARFNALASDAVDAHGLVNGAAQDIRDRLSATGRP